MNITAQTLCLLIALILFVIAFVVQLVGSSTGKVNLELAGFCFLTLAFLAG